MDSSSPQVFVRKASGLVREISSTQLMFYNYLTAPIWVGSLYAFTQNPNTFPGGSLPMGILMLALLSTPMFLTYAMVYSIFPRSGTDYVFQSRVLHPAIGFASALAAWVIYQFWYVAWDGISIVEFLALPYLTVLSVFTGNPSYATIAKMLMEPAWLTAISFIIVIGAGLVVMAGLRLYLRIQAGLFAISLLSVVAMFAMLIGTSHAAFAANFNQYMSGFMGTADSYSQILNTARTGGFDLLPSFSLFSTFGSVIILWTWTLEWPAFGNMNMSGEIKKGNAARTQALTILGAFYLLCIVIVIFWLLFIGMVGEEFWNSVAYLTWNGNPIFANVPTLMYYPLVVGLGTNNIVLLTIFTVAASLSIISTQFTIYVGVTRMIFAQTFDRMFPAALARLSTKSRTPIYIMVLMIVLSCIWTYGVLFFGQVVSAYFASTQFQISVSMILTMVGALILPTRLKTLFERSQIARYKLVLMVCAAIGVILNLLIIYYLVVVPDLYALVPQSEALIIGVFVASAIYYYFVKMYRRSQAIDIELAFKEVPPE